MKTISNPRWKDVVALAVHRAVIDYTEDDGVRHCDLYALAGMFLLREVTGLPYQIQLGSLMYLADPVGHGWFEINARDGGMERLEFHAWIGLAGSVVKQGQGSQSNECEISELIDFSTRHVKTMVHCMQCVTSAIKIGNRIFASIDPDAERVKYTRADDPPAYLWTDGELPDEFRYAPDHGCIVSYYDMLKQRPYVAMELKKLVLFHYGYLLESTRESVKE